MSLIEILKIIVVGIVEGFTEWLPISSTGHMILIDEIISLDMTPEFREVFMNVIQLGAMLALIIMYFRRLNPFDSGKNADQKLATWKLWLKIAIATVPAGVIGLILDDWVDSNLSSGLVVAVSLIVYGVAFIVIENINKRKAPVIERLGKLDYQTALYIGLFQMLAIIPGTSRSGSTILGAMLLGCARPVAAEFSFFLAIPMMAGRSLVKIVKYGMEFSGTEIVYMLVGSVTAFLVSIYSVRFFIGWIKKNNFKLFGYYRIILGTIVLLWYEISSLIG